MSRRMPRAAARFDGMPCELRRHAPLLGEHTAEVLGEVGGLSTEQVRALFDSRVAQTVEGKVPDRSKSRKRDSRLNQVPSG